MTKSGYFCIPSIKELQKLSFSELMSVQSFVIENEFVKLEYLEPVNLWLADIDKIVSFKHNSIELYPDSEYSDPQH